MNKGSISRRLFLAALGGQVTSGANRPERSMVLQAHSKGALDSSGALKEDCAERMIESVFAQFEEATRLFGPDERVALKLNCLAGSGLSPKPPLVWALCRKLVSLGVKPGNIVLWDRSNRELQRAGYDIQTESKDFRVFGTDALDPGYESEPFVHRSVGSCYSRILTRFATIVIGIGVLKDHDLSGVSAGMKNFFGAIHNPNKYHDNRCDPYIADLCSQPLLKDKWRLSLVDATHAQFHGGPALNPAYRWAESSLLAGLDPVAVDAVGWRRIEEKRKEAGMKSLEDENRAPVWLNTADTLGLGNAREDRIELVRIEV
ncbi:MAG: DUF362 domain-containing protein [Deltaproteobacteria bacterium]|nr:DUF362 domain-containing protein [Deltaproteobacteria bacterium]